MTIERMYLERVPLEAHPADGLLGDSLYTGPEDRSAEVAAYWHEAHVTSNLIEQQIEPRKTHDQYVMDGQVALEVAIETEKMVGLDATVHLFREAGIQFLGAIGSQYTVETTHDNGKDIAGDIEEVDPLILLQYATCIAKQAESSNVDPYQNEDSRSRDRREDLKKIAKQTFRQAWNQVMGSGDVADEVILPVAIVTAERLETMQEPREAKNVLREARLLLATNDRDSELVTFIDKYAGRPDKERPYTERQVATVALLGLTAGSADSHEYLLMI